MDALVDLSWRAYPASLLMAFGTLLALRGLRKEFVNLRASLRGVTSAVLPWIEGSRMTVFGLALLGLGGAWLWQETWLLLLALAIGGEELLESSIVIFALRRAKRLQADHV